jgi:hypothetical protein
LSSLTAIFGNSPDKSEEESEKLLNLYWNRAELKKEFARLRNEQYRLQERVNEHEGAAARVQQKLDHLESLLLDPEWIYNVVVYYRFRALNRRCRSKLEKFAEHLKQQREERIHSREVERWEAARAEEATALERSIGEQRLEVQLLEDRLQHDRHRLASMGGLMKLLRGRKLMSALDDIATSIEAAQQREAALLDELETLQQQEPPDTRGLDVATKRQINFMILSFAQHLYQHFHDDGLVDLAKEAADRSVGAVNYGNKQDCDRLVARIQSRLDDFEGLADLADSLKQRARHIAEQARFSREADAVPAADSVSGVYTIGPGGASRKYETNLLGEDYWGLSEIISR